MTTPATHTPLQVTVENHLGGYALAGPPGTGFVAYIAPQSKYANLNELQLAHLLAHAVNAHAGLIPGEIQDTLRDAESAMFHVLADRGFNGPADRDAMQQAHKRVRVLMERLALADAEVR